MADTKRADFPDKYCAKCGNKGCYIMHWGPMMDYKKVYLDECIMNMGHEGEVQLFNCDTGEALKNN